LKSNCVIEVYSQYEKYRKFSVAKRKPSRATTESTLFPVSKDEWDTKEEYSHEECIVCTAVCQKAPLGLKQHQTVKKSST